MLILTVSVGVGIFLAIALLRILLGVNLNVILAVFYVVALALAFFLPAGFRPLAFDSGGVTTGPMTVPFIMSLGAGVSAARKNSEDGADSFGLNAGGNIVTIGLKPNGENWEIGITNPIYDPNKLIACRVSIGETSLVTSGANLGQPGKPISSTPEPFITRSSFLAITKNLLLEI